MSLSKVKADVVNFYQGLENPVHTNTSLLETPIVQKGDLALVAFVLPPHSVQKPHYHKNGWFDVFMVLEGEGILRIAEPDGENQVAGTEQVLHVKKGDCYSLDTYVIHSLENQGDVPLLFLNVAHPSHADEDVYFVQVP